MKQLTILIALALIVLSGCAKDPQIAEISNGEPSIQATTQAYNPQSIESVVLHSSSTYGSMIWNDPNVDFATSNGGGAVWLGPWVDGSGPYPREMEGHCRGKDCLCYIIIDASSSVANVFQGEGVSISNYNNPSVLIRVFMGYSDMVLMDNFSHNNSTGVHTGYAIAVAQ